MHFNDLSFCRSSTSMVTGWVDARFNVTSYDSGISNSGRTKPYLALSTTQAAPKHSAYSRLSLNGVPMYASAAAIGPQSGCFDHILLDPQGTITRTSCIRNVPYVIRGRIPLDCAWRSLPIVPQRNPVISPTESHDRRLRTYQEHRPP